ncbi:SUI1 family translation initiation factor [Halobacterium jilantaiense]|uniref:Protein translation factor SUI1 homolog n=1 Tax=Halobacterium jilantaiense TaxID=355548 RepID=A0A1I0QIP0_9EURY|nr:translation initiation factor [Halobacterium jilantaiense]SEW26875.1 translation initiation factor 1 [Halobacterium jilantaiense]
MSEDDPFEGIDVPGIEDVARAEQTLSVRIERRTYDKPVTVVEGFDPDVTDVDDVATTLKKRLGAGGTARETSVEVQGDHEDRVKDVLEEDGFAVER